jgi:diguanylate cyclase
VARQLASFSENERLLRERDVLAAELRRMAFHDGLTGLANRTLFHDRVDAALTRVRRGTTQIAVLLDRPGRLQAGQRPLRARRR